LTELRTLVGRIIAAAAQVTSATGVAQHTSAQLPPPPRNSLSRFRQTVLRFRMARAHERDVGVRFASASVARQSLAAAAKRHAGRCRTRFRHDEIREQIQRPPSASSDGRILQEIGEIVELISDITEQTNVFA